MYKYIHTCIYIQIYMSAHIHTYTYMHTHIQNVHIKRTQARLERRRGSERARSRCRSRKLCISLSFDAIKSTQESKPENDQVDCSRRSEKSMKKTTKPWTSHTQSRQCGEQTTSRSSALVRGRSTQFIANPCRWPQRPYPKRGYVSANLPPFCKVGKMSVWGENPPHILQIHLLHQVATVTPSHVPLRRRGIIIAIFRGSGTNCMVPSNWDLALKCVLGLDFISYLIGESPILSATFLF